MLGGIGQAFDPDSSIPGALSVPLITPQWIVEGWKPGSAATRERYEVVYHSAAASGTRPMLAHRANPCFHQKEVKP